ncbi:hypothetical protein SAMN04487945_1317 [Halobacterium jilantaiense]|uniref:Uncharacterized protein n=1 Tax=Halobacterium jilantaiense TaxID=355548 RepID=A0A1I0P182_9EURY|nr:hypothetical protein SAMN04487945_1317 [Halobacterium jilantaiense]
MVGVTEFDARPPTVAVAPAAVAAVVALVPALGSGIGLALGAAGAGLLVFGAQQGTRRFVSLGAATLAVGVVFGAATGLDPAYTLVGGVGTVVAYDAGEHAVSLGVDVGRDARVGQSVLVHVFSTAALSALVAAVTLVVYTFGPRSLPVTALVTLLLGGTLLAYVLRT